VELASLEGEREALAALSVGAIAQLGKVLGSFRYNVSKETKDDSL